MTDAVDRSARGSLAAARLVLASASPRRRDLLAQIGLVPAQVLAPDVSERPMRGEPPGALAVRLAREKAAVGARVAAGAFVLACDTVVARGRRVLPKAEDAATARACLDLLSGAAHRVHGGIAVVTPEGRAVSRLVETRVVFKRLAREEIEAYLASGEWHGKAGGYAIQGRAGAFVRHLSGSYFNVVGLPLYETLTLLRGVGFCPDHGDGG